MSDLTFDEAVRLDFSHFEAWLKTQQKAGPRRYQPPPTTLEDRVLHTDEEVAWAIRNRADSRTVRLSAVHRVAENGETFCKLVIPPAAQILSLELPLKLTVCRRCKAMSARGKTLPPALRSA